MRKLDIDINNLINAYNAGKSVKALAQDLNVSRTVVINRLKNAGITPRNRSDSMFLRMSQTSPEERKRLVLAANTAKRGKPNTAEMLHKRALAGKRHIGRFEQEFIDALTDAGVPVIPQEPFLSYNLDIGCGDVAVEIHIQVCSPLSNAFITKLMKCVKAGKNMIYVWIKSKNPTVTSECYKNVIALVQSVRSNPPSQSKYWVIRSTGELYASGGFDGD